MLNEAHKSEAYFDLLAVQSEIERLAPDIKRRETDDLESELNRLRLVEHRLEFLRSEVRRLRRQYRREERKRIIKRIWTWLTKTIMK